MKVMRQSNDDFRKGYEKVLDRMHTTGFDPLFKGRIPDSVFNESAEKDVRTNIDDNACKTKTHTSDDTIIDGNCYSTPASSYLCDPNTVADGL